MIDRTEEKGDIHLTIQRIMQDHTLTFTLQGRLDTLSAPQLHEVLLPSIDGSGDIGLDFTGLAYISSAGLRVLLMAQKQSTAKGITMTISGANADIMEVFDMTGFSDILNLV